MRIGKSEEQRFFENDGLARDCETSFKYAMFLQVRIVHLFSIIKKGLETKNICFSNVKLAALSNLKNDKRMSQI